MAVRLDKPWQPLNAGAVALIAGHLGVYQLADAAGEIVYIGVADARSLCAGCGRRAPGHDGVPAAAVGDVSVAGRILPHQSAHADQRAAVLARLHIGRGGGGG